MRRPEYLPTINCAIGQKRKKYEKDEIAELRRFQELLKPRRELTHIFPPVSHDAHYPVWKHSSRNDIWLEATKKKKKN